MLRSALRRFAGSTALTCLMVGCSTPRDDNGSTTLRDYGIRASNLFFYYDDLPRATAFYTGTLGLELVGDYGMASILRVAPTSYLILVDAAKGMHSTDEPKTVALALVTDQLDQWFTYLSAKGVEMRSELRVREGSAHDGFVAIDPEGYLLEFERFNPHEENVRFIPALAQCETVFPAVGSSDVPDGLGIKATVTWQYYRDLERMQRFYEDVLGLELVCDQGWTKIYQGSHSGFVGLVDESRGMHRFAEDKAVTVSFIVDDLEGWFARVRSGGLFELRSTTVNVDGEGRYLAFVGYDPENYYMEFDRFLEHEKHPALSRYLDGR